MKATYTLEQIPRPPDRDTWLKTRHGYFSASSAATLTATHPYQSLSDEIGRKSRPWAPTPDNAAMRRGNHLEAGVADWWATENGVELYEPPTLFVAGSMMATLDRLIVERPGEAVEIKTTAREISAPLGYWVEQCHAQILCAGLERVHLVAMDSTMTLQTWIIERDDAKCDELARLADAAMHAATTGDYSGLPVTDDPVPDDEETDIDADTLADVLNLSEIRADIKELQDVEKVLKAGIGERLGTATVGTFDGRPVVKYAHSTTARLDTARLRFEQPELSAEYTKISRSRTLRVLK